MREILFRGKRLDNGEWVYGNYSFADCFAKHQHYIFQNKAFEHAVDPSTVGQFTGLMDKNGKRIFEGDICRFREWSRGEMCWIGNVHYSHQQFVISGDPNKECEAPFSMVLSRFASENIEVIGNIHDSEMLEVTPNE